MSENFALQVDPANAAQLEAWDGGEGAYWAAKAEHFNRGVSRYQRPFLEACGIEPDSVILDIGCGTGQTTRDAARIATSGSALGADLSSAMLEVARKSAAAEHLDNVHFEQLDVQAHPFDAGSFDVAISRTGSMFFRDPEAAFTNVAKALRPGGRLTLLVWQPLAENEWLREISGALFAGRDMPMPPADAPGPFAMSDPARVKSILASAGFEKTQLDGLSEKLLFGTDPDDAFDFIIGLNGWMLNGLDQEGRERAMGDLRASLEAHANADGVTYGSAAWLVTATLA